MSNNEDWLNDADWYTDGDSLWIVPHFEAEAIGPDTERLAEINDAYRNGRPDPDVLATQLHLETVPDYLRRGNESDGFYTA